MSQMPRKILAALGATVVALCASVALASPALAEPVTYGAYTFDSDDSLTGVVTLEDGTITVQSSDADITVTSAGPSDTEVTAIRVGGPDEAAYTGEITFSGIAQGTVDLYLDGAIATFEDCAFTGTPGHAAVTADNAPSITISGTCSFTGGAAPSASASGGYGIVASDDCTILVSDPGTQVSVQGGAGFDEGGACTAGGFGIYAPEGTLKMTTGTLNVNAGATDTSAVPVGELPVALTVGSFDLSNASGENGNGPEITAKGWPMENAKPLPVSGFDAGDPSEGSLYPWVLEVSESISGENPWIADYAGSGNVEPIVRGGWQYFHIAPQTVTGVKAIPYYMQDEFSGIVGGPFLAEINPLPNTPSNVSYTIGLVPVFQGLDELVDRPIIGAILNDTAISPEGIIERDADDGTYSVVPDVQASDDEVTVSGTASLPETFTKLFPELSASISTPIDVVRAKGVYRLYNAANGTHLYTTDPNEVVVDVRAGWNFEGPYWLSPADPSADDVVIKRLYNPNNGDHYFIESTNEGGIAFLKSLGWQEDSSAADIVSLSSENPVGWPVRTLFNPHSTIDTHLYTPLESEVAARLADNWQLDDTIIYCY